MKAKCAFIVFACACLCSSNSAAQVTSSASRNEARQIRFAERIVLLELARSLSPSVRTLREKCQAACPETGALELAIGLMGISKHNASSKALINLLGLHLDGAGSEELSCQILIRGSLLVHHIEKLQPENVVEQCQFAFLTARYRELRDVTDVKIEQVCRSVADVQKSQVELLKAIKSKALCEL